MRTSIFSCVALVLIFGLLTGIMPLGVQAHGSGVAQLVEVPAGPYLVTVWLSPAEPRADEAIHVTVGVQLPDDSGNTHVLDADIMLQIWSADTDQLITSTSATTEQSVNKLLYESDFLLDQAGRYTVIIQIRGAAGQGETSFDMTLQSEPSGTNWALIIAAALGLLATVGFIATRARKRILSVSKS